VNFWEFFVRKLKWNVLTHTGDCEGTIGGLGLGDEKTYNLTRDRTDRKRSSEFVWRWGGRRDVDKGGELTMGRGARETGKPWVEGKMSMKPLEGAMKSKR